MRDSDWYKEGKPLSSEYDPKWDWTLPVSQALKQMQRAIVGGKHKISWLVLWAHNGILVL